MQIITFNGTIANQPSLLVNARELHQRLQVGRDFSNWIKDRIANYSFQEGLDFSITSGKSSSFFGRPSTDYHLTLDMAKELCMLERSELGRQARRYFIEMEKQASLEIPRLQAENHALKQQLVGIPAFLRDPDHRLKLVQQAVAALYISHPECKEIVRYRDMGLTNAEIGKLLNLGKKALDLRLNKLFELGLAERRANNQYTQPAQLPLGLLA